jgi:hypothetical protein
MIHLSRTVLGGMLFAACVAIFLAIRSDPSPESPRETETVPSQPLRQMNEAKLQREEPREVQSRPAPRPLSPPAEPHAPPRPVRAKSAAGLEQEIRAARTSEERIELIAELAHLDAPDAVLAIERLFATERHPAVQTALVASLAEMDPAVQPETRLRLLRMALGPRPREVRTTALEILADSDDPAARELLKESSTSDPDHEVREVAAALYGAQR